MKTTNPSKLECEHLPTFINSRIEWRKWMFQNANKSSKRNKTKVTNKWSKTNYVQILMNEILDSNCDCVYLIVNVSFAVCVCTSAKISSRHHRYWCTCVCVCVNVIFFFLNIKHFYVHKKGISWAYNHRPHTVFALSVSVRETFKFNLLC